MTQQQRQFDLAGAVDINRDALLRVVALLFASAGLVVDPHDCANALPRHLRNFITRILRPAEAAARRLVLITARQLIGPVPTGPKTSNITQLGRGPTHNNTDRIAAFQLFDPLKRFNPGEQSRNQNGRWVPRLTVIGVSGRPVPVEQEPPNPDELVDARHILARLRALRRALEDLPGQARRLLRRETRRKVRGQGRIGVMRPGYPPGHRKRCQHDVDDILRECCGLAHYALAPPTYRRWRHRDDMNVRRGAMQ